LDDHLKIVSDHEMAEILC